MLNFYLKFEILQVMYRKLLSIEHFRCFNALLRFCSVLSQKSYTLLRNKKHGFKFLQSR